MDELKLPREVSSQRVDVVELRLFIEELACNICRFTHVAQDKSSRNRSH